MVDVKRLSEISNIAPPTEQGLTMSKPLDIVEALKSVDGILSKFLELTKKRNQEQQKDTLIDLPYSEKEPIVNPFKPKPREPKPKEPKPIEPKPKEPKPIEPKPEEPITEAEIKDPDVLFEEYFVKGIKAIELYKLAYGNTDIEEMLENLKNDKEKIKQQIIQMF